MSPVTFENWYNDRLIDNYIFNKEDQLIQSLLLPPKKDSIVATIT